MKAITIRQPWAAWIFTPHPIMHVKNVENRTWRTSHRGPLAIHAGQKLAEGFTEHDIAEYRTFRRQDSAAWTRGAIIGVVDLLDICRPNEHERCRHSEWAIWEGYHHWVIENPRLLPIPIQMPGRPGVFDVDLDLDYSPKASRS